MQPDFRLFYYDHHRLIQATYIIKKLEQNWSRLSL